MWSSVLEWFNGIGVQYGVNPIVFAVLYVASLPLFAYASARLVYALAQKKSPLVPFVLWGVSVVGPYFYVVVAGRNIPWWVYAAIGSIVGVSVIFAVRTLRNAPAALPEGGKADGAAGGPDEPTSPV